MAAVQGLPEGGGHLRWSGDPAAPDAVGVGQLDEVGGKVQVGLGEAALVEQVLPLVDHAQGMVVEDDHDDGDVVVGDGGQLLAVHTEAAVAGHEQHRFLGVAHLGADGGAEAEAHGAEAAGGDELAGVVEVEVLDGPHLMLAHVGTYDGVAGCHAPDGLDDLAGRELAVVGLRAGAVGEDELYIGIVNYDVNSANGQQRELGFRQTVEQDPRVKNITTINVLSTTEDARAGAKEMLLSDSRINVVVTFNEWTSLGVGWAIRDLNRADRIQVVAFDSNVVSVGMLETGEVDALIVQNPYAMGYLGVETAANLMNGQTGGPSVVDTATTIVTRENMYEPESQKILFSFEEEGY